MKIRITSAILISKVLTVVLRILGSGGTSFPGKAAMFFKKDLLSYLSNDICVVVITGTNGKTTTSRIIAEILNNACYSYFENKSGANLISGITASFAWNSTITGRKKFDYAVIECDEAAFKTVGKYLNASIVVVTNIFRDQLDRYGEITHTLNSITDGINSSPNALVILNADDSLSYSISDSIQNKTVLFGINEPPYIDDDDFLSDAPYCIKCKHKYTYNYHIYAHLGDFQCANCGYQRNSPRYYASAITLNPNDTDVHIFTPGHSFITKITLPGAYNIYNALTAVAVSRELGISIEIISKSLSTFESGFGRMEKFILNNISINLILVKNPAGLNQVFNFLTYDKTKKILVMILNDRHADGTDISWIWDANFEKLSRLSEYFSRIILSGTRAEELCVRFKYAGFRTDKFELEKNYGVIINQITADNTGKLPVYILPTYTAMFDFRLSLSKKYKIRKFWK